MAMAAPKQMMRAEWTARAIALAEVKHTTGTPRHIGENAHGAQLWQVPSRTHDGCYVVTIWPIGDVFCGCTAGSYGRPCGHAGAAILAERQRNEARDGPSEAWSWWMAGGEW